MVATRRVALLFVALSLLAPSTPIAGAVERSGVKAADVSASVEYYYPGDLYENDDSTGVARDLTALIPLEGAAPRVEHHTIDIATQTVTYDEDWFKIQVSPQDVISGSVFLIEAFTTYLSQDVALEVYGPGAFVPNPATSGVDVANATITSDDGVWYGFPIGSHVLLRPALHGGAGTYFFRIRPWWNGDVGPYDLRIKRGSIDRIAGADRIATAIAISQQRYATAATPASVNRAVVVANSMNFPDALSGGVLSGMAGGPLLLTPQAAIPASVLTEIQRTGANRVYVLGGTGAVSNAVVSAIQALPTPPAVYRIAGDTRIQTAIEIGLQAQSDAAGYGRQFSKFAIVTNAYNFPDALAASPLSASGVVPILLTGASALDADAEEALGHFGTTNVIVVGGTGVISNAVTTRLATVLGGADHVLRIAGSNRYGTAKAFASFACDLSGPGVRGDATIGTEASSTSLGRLTANRIGIASGESFPDALAGGAMCGRSGFPLLLTPAATASDYIFESHDGALPGMDTDFWSDTGGIAILESRAFGGTGALSQAALRTIDLRMGKETGP